MTPLDVAIVGRKLAVIMENLKALEPVGDLTHEEYLADLYKRKATERLLQELVETAVDINTHILVESGNTVPDYYYESFIGMGEIGAIPPDLAEKLAPSAGLRNRLVHEYDRLDHNMVLAAVRMVEELYPLYIKEIEGYIAGKSS